MRIEVTENKSSRADQVTQHNMVRVFLDGDYAYGAWINEHEFLTQGLAADSCSVTEYFCDGSYRADVTGLAAERIRKMYISATRKSSR